MALRADLSEPPTVAGSACGMPRRGLLRCLLAGVAMSVAAGCTTSRTIAPGTVSLQAGEEVQVRLTPAGAVRFAEASGRTERVYRGTLQEEPREALVLAVPSRQEGRSIAAGNLREVVVIPWADVQELELQEFSAGRTGLLAAGGAAVAYALVRFAFGRSGNNDGGGEPPGELPLTFGWRFPLR